MTPQETELHEAINFLKGTKEQMAGFLPSHPGLVSRSNHVLTQLINGMCHMAGLPLVTDLPEGNTQQKKAATEPVTHILGIPVTNSKRIKKSEPQTMVNPKEEDVKILKNDVEAALTTFLERDSKDLLESLDHIVIRGVAKKAGMQVTILEPETLTVQFINEVKEAITKMNEINSKVDKADKNSKRGKQ